MNEPAEAPFKSGFVVLAGRPNVGKSTLLNALLKFKLSIVSPKPQTTRHKILGILGGPRYQICFLDTPGLIAEPRDPLQKVLKRAARTAAHKDADVIVLLVEPQRPGPRELEELSGLGGQTPLILALNKSDLPSSPGAHEEVLRAYSEALKPAAALKISALRGTGVEELLEKLLARLPDCPPYYDQDGQLSDRPERFFAAEMIREQVFALYRQEIPHATAVVVEEFLEKKGTRDWISAVLYVEKDGQKAILLGKGGQALRDLSEKSRRALSEFLGRPVDLQLWVKVRRDWRRDPRSLREFGYLA